MSPLLAAAYERTLMPQWVRATQALDAVCVLLRVYGESGMRAVGLQLHSLDVARDAAEALDLLAYVEGRSWELRAGRDRAVVEDACRAARVELMCAVEHDAATFESVADTLRAAE